MPEPPPASVAGLVARQFANALVALLLGAAALSVALGELLEGAVILAIVVANAALGALQEGRADSASRALRSLLAPSATVVRGGSAHDVDAAELVEGDVVLLTAGDRVPADARLLSGERLEIDESILTGESQPAGKRAEPPDRPEAQLGDRATMAFAGTTATRGRGRALVTGTGRRSEVGTIAEAAGGPRRRTPLERRLDRVAGVLLEVSVAICLGLAAIAWANGDSLADSLLVGVSLAVAAVPEGLPAVVTITLALGMSRLAQRGAVVRRLRAVETLGSTTVICTDKTGTLTTNRMRVERLRAVGGEPELLGAAILASEGGTDPGEAAIAAAGAERGIERERLLDGMALVGGEPFDAERKRMSVVVEDKRGRRVAYVKGAPDVLLPRIAPDAAVPELEQLAAVWADSGVRLLLVAERTDLPPGGEPEEDLRPLGLIGIVDPPRESAPPSVDRARRAGIRTVMITGDHPRTATAVARACGIVPDDRPPAILTGQELDLLSEDELRDLVGRVEIYARVVPQQKLTIVAALQDAGEVVAMTGDGVNDAPALAAADIGVAMGSGGSDAAIDASDVVLTDNDFATIVVAVAGGRTIYANIRRFLQFLLAANAGEVLAFALAIVPGLGPPLSVAQILLVNLLTDGMPAVALGVDPPDERSMQRPPRPPSEGLFAGMRGDLLLGGVLTGAAVFAAFLIGHQSSPALGQTMAFTTLVFSKLTYVYAIRGENWFFRAGRNRSLHAAVLLSALVGAAVLAVPSLWEGFGVVAMDVGDVAVCVALMLLPFAGAEALKAVRRARSDPTPAPP